LSYDSAAENLVKFPARFKNKHIYNVFTTSMGVRENSNQLSGFSCKLFVLRLTDTFIDCKHLNFRIYPKTQKELSSRPPAGGYRARDTDSSRHKFSNGSKALAFNHIKAQIIG
jgi:hypothetical protein